MADMSFALTDDQKALKAAVYELCKQYPPAYWQELDAKREYPDAIVTPGHDPEFFAGLSARYE